MEHKHTVMLCYKAFKERKKKRKFFKVIYFQVSHKGHQAVIKLL